MSNTTRRSRLTRRRFLGSAGVTVGGLIVSPALLAACGDDDDGGGDGSSSSGGGGGGNRLYVANWVEYIDEETAALFEEDAGIDLRYEEEINDNNEYFAEIQPVLSRGDRIDPDIIVPTSWLAGRLIQLGWVDTLPLDQVPNLSNLRDDLVDPSWDPTGEYSLPWQTGVTGIAYNRAAAGRDLGSVEDLFDPAFKGRIGMLTEMRDTMGLLMLMTGADPESPTFDAAAEAFEKLEEAVNSDQIRQFTGNDYLDDLEGGNFVACIGWSGDVAQLSVDNPDIRFVIPEEGGMSWADTMVMPKGAVNRDAAAKWMDYVYDPVNAARLTAYIQFVSPVKGVAEELAKIGPDEAALAENPLVFPDDATLAKLKGFGPLSEEDEASFDEEFSRISGV